MTNRQLRFEDEISQLFAMFDRRGGNKFLANPVVQDNGPFGQWQTAIETCATFEIQKKSRMCQSRITIRSDDSFVTRFLETKQELQIGNKVRESSKV